MDNTPPTQTSTPTNHDVTQKTKKPTKLIVILCVGILLAIALIIGIVIVSLRPNNGADTNQSTNPSDDVIANCIAEQTTVEPFASITLEPPYTGVFESTGDYLCNAELSYAVKIPQNVSKVFYILMSGGDVTIVGLEVDGQIMASPITQENFSLVNAGVITSSTKESWDQFVSEYEDNWYTLVLTNANNQATVSPQSNQEPIAVANELYGDGTSGMDLVILFVGAINEVQYDYGELEDIALDGTSDQVEITYSDSNQELSNLVSEIFGNPNNYYKLEASEPQD